MSQKNIYIIGGPNGSGKTTFVKQFLPEYVHVSNFVNADDIAIGLSPLDASSMNITSGKLMLKLINKYMSKGESFGFETTLAGRKWISLFEKLKIKGYSVHLFFLDLFSLKLSISRVKYRVKLGGHSIPKETIIRRYGRSRKNFWNIYKDKTDLWSLFDNSGPKPELVAASKAGKLEVFDNKYYNYFIDSIRK